MALPYATENQLKQVTKSEVTKAINPILATGSIRKKPYVEKVVESLSSESLELLRETLNTNKDNVNVSLVGGSNLLKKFEKELKGAVLSDGEGTIYINFDLTYDKLNEMFESLPFIESSTEKLVILGNDGAGVTSIGLSKTKTAAGYSKSIALSIGDTPDYYTYAYFYNEEEFELYKSIHTTISGVWNEAGWYQLIINDQKFVKISGIQIINNCIFQDIQENYAKKVTELFSFNTPFKTNTQLIGHIPAVGDTVEKVYFNPNAYSTDEEWKLWYEGMKSTDVVGDPSFKGLYTINGPISFYVLDYILYNGIILNNVYAIYLGNQVVVGYITNDALTGTYAQVYQQLGITETGWYKIGGSTSSPTVTKVSSTTEYSDLFEEGSSVTEINETNAKHFAKALSFNEEFTETPIQNLLKPNPIQVGQEVSKIYINLGYFDNDLNKMKQYIGEGKVLFKLDGNEFQIGFGDTAIIKFSQENKHLLYLTQKVVSESSIETQDDVNKWALEEEYDVDKFRVLEIIDTNVYEYEIQGTITELGDTSLISFNKPFEVEGGWIYEDVTPVTLELEKDLNQDGILIWDDTQCVLLAYYPYKNLIDIFVIDPEDYTYEKLSESATIEELRRVVFTPTQETSVVDNNAIPMTRFSIRAYSPSSAINEKYRIFQMYFALSEEKLYETLNTGFSLLNTQSGGAFSLNTQCSSTDDIVANLDIIKQIPATEDNDLGGNGMIYIMILMLTQNIHFIKATKPLDGEETTDTNGQDLIRCGNVGFARYDGSNWGLYNYSDFINKTDVEYSVTIEAL